MPAREVHCGDGIAYLARARLPADHAIFTSLPDHRDVAMTLPVWKRWFVETVTLACNAIADDAVAIFYQTDEKHEGRWIDKGHLVLTGADAAGSHALWHKVVGRAPAGTVTYGRPGYAHVICVSREHRLSPSTSTADVLPALGTMSWSRAMGRAACEMAIEFIASTGARTMVDPFCGHGTALAAANARGLDAIGVELSKRRAAKARKA